MWRLFHLAAYATAFALFAWAETPPAKPAAPLVGVYMDFDHAPQRVPVEVMKRAVEGLLKPAGIRLAWRSVSDNLGKEAFPQLAVLKFKGRCEGIAPGPGSDFGTLGEVDSLASTAVSGGHVLPYTQVECDQVRKALAYMPPGTGALERQTALGMALGRVVAHELYHILANTASHAGNGLAKASELLQDLVSTNDLKNELKFDQGASRAIRKGFQREK